ncbi:MetQ/NlpA family ABC transporter substrate-binding protein [Helicobacter sp. MIT 14-3879]|uniref:MetQ/NlpA family ABC transporter substrate-binding protein n=1 Tax=Helicobacter sp. MIT 14-3879 TaxID=2040649 RepID=UPI000E1EDD36|nr:MetQ/NlpA family ABC transporter substrate-binding protein [Helicobacter sp. MIT 14-3879]RDU62077.1 ABC transporter substrate-binding protein [Helicobacter sp. MIT 14-3879]
MKKIFFYLFISFVLLYAKQDKLVDLKVGATPVPAAEILEFAKPLLAKEGINLIVQSFTDYVTPDVALNEGSSDANMYQHKPFLEKMNKDRGMNLVALKPIYIVPLGFYSKKFKTLDSIKDGSTIALPNDPTNYSRALILLHDNGLIKLKDSTNLNATEFDIVDNPKKFKFHPVDAAMLPKILDGVDSAVINANYALQAGMSIKEAFFYENNKSIFVNILATKKGNEKNINILKLQEILLGKEVRDFILKKYNGEIVPISK